MKKLAIAAAVAASAIVAGAADIYVSLETGKNKNPGTKEAPLKNLWKALENAKDGDVIHLAEGVYPGKMKQNWFLIDKAVSILGGYSKDFAERKPLEHKTMFQALNENNDKKGTGLGVFTIDFTKQAKQPEGVDMKFDGLIFDEGFANSYHETKGKPEGFDTGMWLEGPAMNKTRDKFPSANRYLVYSATANRVTGKISFTNCAFVNSGNIAFNVTWYQGEVVVENCVFCNNRMIGANVLCSKAIPQDGPNKPKAGWKPEVNWLFKNNTVLFTWSRLKDMGDMGYAFRYNNRTDSYVHHNIFGCSVFAALDRGRTDTPKDREARKVTTSEHNMFFLNKRGDLALPGGGMFMMVNCEDFEEVEQLAEIDGCVRLKDPSVLKGKINEAYLNGFINVSYKESLSSDPNSPENQFRSAMGMNQTGKMTSSATMFANRYPFDDALKMFGAIKDFGAQLPK